MRALSGMIRPTAGEVTLGGKRIDGLESHRIARLGLAHSPEGRRVFPTLSVTDNLLLGAFPRLTGSRPKGDVQADLGRAMDLFRAWKERREQLAGTVRRRTADAGHGPRRHAEPGTGAAGRTVHGPGAILVEKCSASSRA